MQGNYCKALSLENCQFSEETLSVSSQDPKKNVNNPNDRVGGVTGGIRARSCDHRLALHKLSKNAI